MTRKLLLALLALLLISGCNSRPVNRHAERKIRDALPSYIGPAAKWDAHVENPWDRTLDGKLRDVTIDGSQVKLDGKVLIDSLHLRLRGVEIDLGSSRLKSVRQTTFRAVISEAGLNDYIRSFPPPPEEPVRVKHVTLRDGKLHAQSTRWLLGREWGFSVTAEPRLESDVRLRFDPDKVRVLGLTVPLPASVLRFFANYMSEGFDFRTLPFPVHVSSFSVDKGQIEIQGTADIMESLNRKIAEVLREDDRVVSGFAPD
jgi:hypothetical protein